MFTAVESSIFLVCCNRRRDNTGEPVCLSLASAEPNYVTANLCWSFDAPPSLKPTMVPAGFAGLDSDTTGGSRGRLRADDAPISQSCLYYSECVAECPRHWMQMRIAVLQFASRPTSSSFLKPVVQFAVESSQ